MGDHTVEGNGSYQCAPEMGVVLRQISDDLLAIPPPTMKLSFNVIELRVDIRSAARFFSLLRT